MTDDKKIDDLDAVRIISDTLNAFKGDEQQRIMRWVHEKLNLVPMKETKPISDYIPPSKNENIKEKTYQRENTEFSNTDIRTFINSKRPNSDNQFAACVAYYYRFEAPGDEKKDMITSADLQDATRKAGRNRLGDPGKTLSNASAQGWLDNKTRGNYIINTVGENLVAMTLPSSTSGESIPSKKSESKKNTFPNRKNKKQKG